jgi:hypothetical protein
MIMRVVLGILLILALAAGFSAVYHVGFAQGIAQSGHMPAPGPGMAYPMYPYGYGWHFGFFGFLWPLLWIVLLIALFRGMFWGGRRHWGGGGPWGGGAPRWLEEWHRREHESKG